MSHIRQFNEQFQDEVDILQIYKESISVWNEVENGKESHEGKLISGFGEFGIVLTG